MLILQNNLLILTAILISIFLPVNILLLLCYLPPDITSVTSTVIDLLVYI